MCISSIEYYNDDILNSDVFGQLYLCVEDMIMKPVFAFLVNGVLTFLD